MEAFPIPKQEASAVENVKDYCSCTRVYENDDQPRGTVVATNRDAMNTTAGTSHLLYLHSHYFYAVE